MWVIIKTLPLQIIGNMWVNILKGDFIMTSFFQFLDNLILRLMEVLNYFISLWQTLIYPWKEIIVFLMA